MNELQGTARRFITGKKPDWLSFNGSLKVDGAFETTLRNSSTTRDDLLLEPVLQAEQEKEE